METLEAFFVKHPGLCLLLILGSCLAYAAVSLWLWHRKNGASETKAVTTPDWVSALPPVYTAENVHKGQDYWIWCAETMREQRFRVLDVQGEWFEVRFTDDPGNIGQGWFTEVPSDALLHGGGHLIDHIPKKPLAA